MLRFIIVAITITMMTPIAILLIIVRKAYSAYKLAPLKMKELIAFISILYLIFTSLGNLSTSKSVAFFFFESSIIILTIMAILAFLYFRLLRTEKIAFEILIICFLIIFLKVISLISNPIQIHKHDDIFVREADLSIYGVVASITVLALISIEAGLLYKDASRKPHGKKYSRYLLNAYSIVVILVPLYLVGSVLEIFSIFIPYLQGVLVSMIALYLAIVFRKKPEKLVLLPVHIRGLLLHTYGGLAIFRKALDPSFERVIALSSSLVASIIGLETAIEELRKTYIFRVHQLIETTIIMFFGKITVGTFVLNRDNSVIRAILRKIVLEFERTVGYIDEGMITDEEITIAKKILNRYMEFLS